MSLSSILPISGFSRQHFSLGDLLARVDDPVAHWTDLPARPGIYAVLWSADTPLTFRAAAGARGEALLQRWQAIIRQTPTDILYIGKATSLRNRIRQLACFGRGHAVKHQGGQDLWWINGIERASVLLLECPDGEPTGFKNAALERFYQLHGDYPLANRQGPVGDERWWPM